LHPGKSSIAPRVGAMDPRSGQSARERACREEQRESC
jgi:hypothetical protein